MITDRDQYKLVVIDVDRLEDWERESVGGYSIARLRWLSCDGQDLASIMLPSGKAVDVRASALSVHPDWQSDPHYVSPCCTPSRRASLTARPAPAAVEKDPQNVPWSWPTPAEFVRKAVQR